MARDGSQQVRFAFCKRDETLDAAAERLRKLQIPEIATATLPPQRGDIARDSVAAENRSPSMNSATMTIASRSTLKAALTKFRTYKASYPLLHAQVSAVYCAQVPNFS